MGLVGINGAGKTSVLRLLDGTLTPSAGRVKRGRTVAIAHLTQDLAHIDSSLRVLDAVEESGRVLTTARGEVTASALLERFGFTGERLVTRVGDLSGGERRRLQILRLLLPSPNVLLLDEPTNDLDVETLTVLEDHLDSWPGTLVVVSHDRYFLERVCDTIWALPGDGTVRMLPRGVEEYLELVTVRRTAPVVSGSANTVTGASTGDRRAARKQAERLERQITRLDARERDLHRVMAAGASDHVELARLTGEAGELSAERAQLEEQWLQAAEAADG
jgi:ATP-binding cassette subfamily F protein uup